MEYRLKSHYPGVDLLRGLSALLIVFYHVMSNSYDPKGEWWRHLLPYTTYALDVFFIVTGFLLTERFREHYQSMNFPKLSFLNRRFFRLYPMYFLACVIFFFQGREAFHLTGWHFFANVSFIGGFLPGNEFNYSVVGWSLFVTIWFVLLIPLTTKFLVTTQRVLFFLILSVALSLIYQHGIKDIRLVHEYVPLFHRQPFKYLHFFTLGIFIYHIKAKVLEHRGVFLKVSLAIIFLWVGSQFLFDHHHQPVGRITIVALILLMLVATPGFAGHWLFFPIRRVGELCYGFYLFHLFSKHFIGGLLNQNSDFYGSPYKFEIHCLATVFFCFFIAFFLHHLYEKQFWKIGMKVEKKIEQKKRPSN